MIDLANRAEWMSDPNRKCLPPSDKPKDIRTHADHWFPTSGKWDTAAFCHGCPVQLACLQYALDNPELEGIWAGTNEQDRKILRGSQATA